MANNFFGSICLTDIPRELITTGKNGKKYLTIVVNERREPGQYGHTHYIKAYAKKGSVAPDTNLFIGELKPSDYGNEQQHSQTQAAPSATLPPPAPANDDLPF